MLIANVHFTLETWGSELLVIGFASSQLLSLPIFMLHLQTETGLVKNHVMVKSPINKLLIPFRKLCKTCFLASGIDCREKENYILTNIQSSHLHEVKLRIHGLIE